MTPNILPVIALAQAESIRPQGRNPHGVHTTSYYHSNIIISYNPSICNHLFMFSLNVGAFQSPIQELTLLNVLTIQKKFIQYFDRQCLIMGCGLKYQLYLLGLNDADNLKTFILMLVTTSLSTFIWTVSSNLKFLIFSTDRQTDRQTNLPIETPTRSLKIAKLRLSCDS